MNASFIDIFKEGAVGTIAFGQSPFTTNGDGGPEDPDSNFIVEANYKYPINKNISITPGIYAIFNPENNSRNNTIVVGVIRTVFKF